MAGRARWISGAQLRNARRAVLLTLSSLAIAACNSIVGFGDLEKVDDKKPDPLETEDDAGTSSRDSGRGGTDSGTSPTDSGSGQDSSIPKASTTCPATAPTSYPPYKSPPSRPKPCTTQDVQAFVDNERQAFDLQKSKMMARNAACAACVFTTESDATWGPITHTNDDRVFNAFGYCYRMAGASEACGQAAHELEWCLQKACNVCSAGLSLTECRNKVNGVGGDCNARLNTTVDACKGFGTIVNVTCATSAQVVGVMCGGA